MPKTWGFDGKLPEVLKRITIPVILFIVFILAVYTGENAYNKYQEERHKNFEAQTDARMAEEEERYNWFYGNATEVDERDEEILNENCGMIGRTVKGQHLLILSTLYDIVEHGDSVYFYTDDSEERNYYRCSSSFIIDDFSSNGGKS